MNQAPRSAQLLRAVDGDFDLRFGFLDGDFAAVGEVVSSEVSIELEACAFSTCFCSPTFVKPAQL